MPPPTTSAELMQGQVHEKIAVVSNSFYSSWISAEQQTHTASISARAVDGLTVVSNVIFRTVPLASSDIDLLIGDNNQAVNISQNVCTNAVRNASYGAESNCRIVGDSYRVPLILTEQ